MIENFIKEANKYKGNLKKCFEMGYDSAINGSNTENCHFGLFATKEMSEAWSKGNKLGLKHNTILNKKNMENINEIQTVNDIDTKVNLGKLLLAAIAIITTESQRDKTPDEVIEQLNKLANSMFTTSGEK